MMSIEAVEKFDILDKADKSLRPGLNNSVQVKRLTYKWSDKGDAGTFRWIYKGDLRCDGRYQRDAVSDKKISDIAANWDWLLLGTISVIEREDGSLWVFDGGHRVRASFYRDDIDMLPCLVHHVANVSEEAKAFVAKNTMLTAVSAHDRFKASVCANEDIAKKVRELIDENGLVLSKAATSRGYINCIGALIKCAEMDFESLKTCLGFLISMGDDKPITGRLLLAMVCLHRHFKPKFDILDRYGSKLAGNSFEVMEKKMTNFSMECGKTGYVIHAKGLLELINKGNRNRLSWDD